MKAKKKLKMIKMENECKSKECEEACWITWYVRFSRREYYSDRGRRSKSKTQNQGQGQVQESTGNTLAVKTLTKKQSYKKVDKMKPDQDVVDIPIMAFSSCAHLEKKKLQVSVYEQRNKWRHGNQLWMLFMPKD